jgi:hypothetical protein
MDHGDVEFAAPTWKNGRVNRAVAKVQALRARFDEEKRQLDSSAPVPGHRTPPAPRAGHGAPHRARARLLAISRRSTPEARTKKTLRAILKEQLDEVFSHVDFPDADLKALFERLHGVGYAEAAQSELEEARSGRLRNQRAHIRLRHTLGSCPDSLPRPSGALHRGWMPMTEPHWSIVHSRSDVRC